jgi:hypothetical protein
MFFSVYGLSGLYSLRSLDFCNTAAMRFRRPIPLRATSRRIPLTQTLFRLSLLILTVSAPLSFHAQTPSQPTTSSTPAQPSPHEGAPYVLHLYARLVELPTIILLPRNHASFPVDPQNVNIALDSERSFHPTSIRLEGNDTLSLAILLDDRNDESNILPAFSQDFSAWVTGSFKPHDHISIYSINCNLIRSADDQPPTPALLQPKLDLAIAPLLPQSKMPRPHCPKAVGLRDSIDFIMR